MVYQCLCFLIIKSSFCELVTVGISPNNCEDIALQIARQVIFELFLDRAVSILICMGIDGVPVAAPMAVAMPVYMVLVGGSERALDGRYL